MEQKKGSISIGIDISKLTFDIAVFDGKTFLDIRKFKQNETGFKEFLELVKLYENPVITCEATGRLFKNLAKFLISNGHNISVVNPLVIKNYGKMLLSRNKTDIADAKLISQYGYYQKPFYYVVSDNAIEELKAYTVAIEMMRKQLIQMNNVIKGLEDDFEAAKDCIEIKQQLIIRIKAIKKKMNKLVSKHYPEEKKILSSIKGIGEEAIFTILTHFNSFKNFIKPEQVLSYIGTSTERRQSGTSVNLPAHISRKGNKVVRCKLYMCTLSAALYNAQCKRLYDRLREKGKKIKVIRIAILNKLLRQAFYCLKHMELYNAEK